MSNKLSATVVEADNLLGNQFQWIKLRELTKGDVGVINVYSLNSPKECYYLHAILSINSIKIVNGF